MSSIPTIRVSEAVHYLDSSLSLETVRYAYDPRPEGSAAITKAYASDAHEFACAECADGLGDTFTQGDIISEDWENVAIVTGNLGLAWTCDMCDKSVQGPDTDTDTDTDTDAYLYIHVME